MKTYSIKTGILGILLIGLAGSSCQKDLVYVDVPESVYSEVGVNSISVSAREYFKDCIWAVNYGEWVSDISTQYIGGTSSATWTNKTGKEYQLTDGTKVEPNETIKLEGKFTEEKDENAPGGKLYVYTTYALSDVQYSTKNKGFLFDSTKMSGNFKLVSPTDNRSTSAIFPVRKNELIVAFTLTDAAACTVVPQNGAPELGKPGDYSKPQQYLVKNISRLPEGVQQYTRLYEVRVTFLPEMGL